MCCFWMLRCCRQRTNDFEDEANRPIGSSGEPDRSPSSSIDRPRPSAADSGYGTSGTSPLSLPTPVQRPPEPASFVSFHDAASLLPPAQSPPESSGKGPISDWSTPECAEDHRFVSLRDLGCPPPPSTDESQTLKKWRRKWVRAITTWCRRTFDAYISIVSTSCCGRPS